MTKFRVGDIHPNPFRDLSRYPINQAKVDKLRSSIASTGFWDNVVARVRPFDPTSATDRLRAQVTDEEALRGWGIPESIVEIAYGHYRLEAVRQELGEDAKVGLIIRNLSDADMLRIMAEENMEEGRNAAEASHEVVRAVVLAYAEGKIELPAPEAQQSGNWRYAPSFRTLGTRTERPYNVSTLVAFLGGSWTVDRVRDAIEQLAAVEARDVPPEVFQDLPRRYAGEIIGAARRAKREAGAAGMDEQKAQTIGREVATEVADSIREGRGSLHGSAVSVAIGEVRSNAIAARVPNVPRLKPAPPAHRVAEQLRDYLNRVFARQYVGTGTYADLLEALIANLGSASLTEPLGPNGPNLEKEIAGALRLLAKQATDYADRIERKTT